VFTGCDEITQVVVEQVSHVLRGTKLQIYPSWQFGQAGTGQIFDSSQCIGQGEAVVY